MQITVSVRAPQNKQRGRQFDMPAGAWRKRYRVCHRFRLTKQDDYFRVDFDLF